MKKREELDKLRDLGDDELRAEAARLRESLFRLNFKLALGEVDAVFECVLVILARDVRGDVNQRVR